MKQKILCCCFLFVIFCNISFTAKAQATDVKDSLALVDLYNSTNGPNWRDHTNWLTDKPVKTWYGITVEKANVTKIDLYFNNVTGTLPLSFGNLSKLAYVSFSVNYLKGDCPVTIGNLANLKYLNFNDNFLTSLPPSIGNRNSLTSLSLAGNAFNGSLPASIGKLTQLTHLDISSCGLKGNVPVFISKLTNLIYLGLSRNELTQTGNAQLPGAQNDSTKVDLSYNYFTYDGLESVVQKFSKLTLGSQKILDIHQYGNLLAVSAGGTLSNNTYKWNFVGETGYTIIVGDSTFHPAKNGSYRVIIDNAVVGRKLELYTYQYNYTAPEVNKHSSVSVYPNPVTDMLNIIGAATNSKITIADAGGYIWITKTTGNQSRIKCDVSRLKPGYYVVNISDGISVTTVKFIKR